MGALTAERVTVLFVEHDMDIVSRYTQRVLAFYEGRIIADGEPEDVLTQSEVRKLRHRQGHMPTAAGGAMLELRRRRRVDRLGRHPAQREPRCPDRQVCRPDRP